MIVGADVNAIVTAAMIGAAEHQTGHAVRFWGRYFKDAGNPSPEQYQNEQEAALLQQKGIRLLPIGRQTNHVNGSEALGRDDGVMNALAVLDSLGTAALAALPGGLLVFLDVEGPPHPTLSADYYKGWSRALALTGSDSGVTLLPAVYGAEGDGATWSQLNAAVHGGAACAGTWIARPGTMGCHAFPAAFNEPHVRPPGLAATIRVLIWQCVQECNNLDFNLMNPTFETDTLGKLVLPQAPAQAAVA